VAIYRRDAPARNASILGLTLAELMKSVERAGVSCGKLVAGMVPCIYLETVFLMSENPCRAACRRSTP
jgi:hypothetical protein